MHKICEFLWVKKYVNEKRSRVSLFSEGFGYVSPITLIDLSVHML